MRMGRRADRLKADDPFLPTLLPSALADFRPCVGVEMDTTLACLPRRDKREDPRRAGHMHTPDNNSHASISPAIARRQLCSAVLCCAVMWLHPLLHRPSSNGAGLLAADPVSHVTQRLSLPMRPFLPFSLSAWHAGSLPPSIERESASLLCPQMSSFNNGRLSEKRPANRAPQYPSWLPAAGRA